MPQRNQNKSQHQKDKSRDQGTQQQQQQRTGTPSSSGAVPQTSVQRSGTSTPEVTTPTTATTTTSTTATTASTQSPNTGATSMLIPTEVREYMRAKWQKYYDDAVTSEKSGKDTSSVILGGQGSAGAGAGAGATGGQGWNTVGAGKGGNKSSNPWGNQNRGTTAKGNTFHQALKAAIEEASNPQKGG